MKQLIETVLVDGASAESFKYGLFLFPWWTFYHTIEVQDTCCPIGSCHSHTY
ncbi:hypothetical protein NBRC111894_1430 [Sporolactobacillus inulinus]|uniref:Uncharacterized protein n=1 Tax=Sporolactobacillus inulinus TaxID=2078 RepID=A0A4Y1ZA19_9BACL|nr:hypothetical protein NBRC111894_1430 [Sporolactobacillus inulinus]